MLRIGNNHLNNRRLIKYAMAYCNTVYFTFANKKLLDLMNAVEAISCFSVYMELEP